MEANTTTLSPFTCCPCPCGETCDCVVCTCCPPAATTATTEAE